MPDIVDVNAGDQPRLLSWLQKTLEAVQVRIEDPTDELPYAVVITNGLAGEDLAETVLARCSTELDAELVAGALWAIVI